MTYTGDQKRAYQLAWIKRRRAVWIQANGPCRQCGSWDELEVDHLDPESKLLNPTHLWSLAPTNPVRITELAKCQVLCRSCHDAKTLAYRREHGFACGTQGGYSHGCRCRLCKDAHAILAREYRSRRRG